jgi:lipopolysaccharide/colanic/teichoic acid biosynthesis glycosyltransferase
VERVHDALELQTEPGDVSRKVDAYNDWQRERLQALPGVSGLWQVGGRSRVTFDEMVFQDLFYATNQSPFLDLAICLRTVPAIINGRGAA